MSIKTLPLPALALLSLAGCVPQHPQPVPPPTVPPSPKCLYDLSDTQVRVDRAGPDGNAMLTVSAKIDWHVRGMISRWSDFRQPALSPPGTPPNPPEEVSVDLQAQGYAMTAKDAQGQLTPEIEPIHGQWPVKVPVRSVRIMCGYVVKAQITPVPGGTG